MGVNEETGLWFPDFGQLALAFHIRYATIKTHADFNKIEARIDEDGPMFFEIFMSPDQIQAPRSVNRRNPDGTMNPTKLEDSFPFLDRDELASMMSLDFNHDMISPDSGLSSASSTKEISCQVNQKNRQED